MSKPQEEPTASTPVPAPEQNQPPVENPTQPPAPDQSQGIVLTQDQVLALEQSMEAIQKQNEEFQRRDAEMKQKMAEALGVQVGSGESAPDFGSMSPQQFADWMQKAQQDSITQAVDKIKTEVTSTLEQREAAGQKREVLSQTAREVATKRGYSDEDVLEAEKLILAFNDSLSELSKNMGPEGDSQKLKESYAEVMDIALTLRSAGIGVDGAKLVQKEMESAQKREAISRIANPGASNTNNSAKLADQLRGQDTGSIISRLLGQ